MMTLPLRRATGTADPNRIDDDRDDHADAHSSFGHVLTHMPIDLAAVTTIRFSPGNESALLSPQFSIHDTPPESPFRPPRPHFSV